VDLLVNSAGIMGQLDDLPGNVDYDEWRRVLDVNALGPVRVLDALVPRLAAAGGAKALTITSGMGSLSDIRSGTAMMYRTSKAAVNMAMRARALQLRDRGITVAVINPGWVRTDMGGPGASISVEQSIAAMRKVIDALTPDQAGSFLNWKGGTYPW
jgi:NAD(P)-dependent dehydrogenase (short-subunit alcohol dehydrogenase family)